MCEILRLELKFANGEEMYFCFFFLAHFLVGAEIASVASIWRTFILQCNAKIRKEIERRRSQGFLHCDGVELWTRLWPSLKPKPIPNSLVWRARTHHQTLATRVTIINDDDALTRPAHAQCSSEADTQQMHHTQHSHIAKCSEITRFILFLNTFLISILRILCGSRHVTLGRPKLLCRRSFGLFLAWQQRNKKKNI